MAMKWIEASTEDGVRILKLNHGVTNALNGALLLELQDGLEEVQAATEINSLVLTSANDKFFSIGFDLPELFHQELSDFKEFFHLFNRICLDLYTLPKPTVAALTGHAVAGGFILASCCDYRFMAQGKKFCALNEIQIGVPVPYIADRVLRQLVGDRVATEIMYTGALLPAEKALEAHFLDALVAPEELLKEALSKARTLGRLPRQAFQIIKTNRTGEIAARGREKLEEDIQVFLKLWYHEEARKLLQEALKKFNR
jgi:enoyl-CoA hydratase/carnithine racemase